jgi:glucokinase-like ROK family protein
MTEAPGPVETAAQSTILSLLRDLGPLARVDLADRLGVSRTTIAAEVTRLNELGLTADGGPAASRGGRRSSLVELAPDLGFLGIDIGSTSIDVALTGPQLDVVAHTATAADIREGPQQILGEVLDMARNLRRKHPDTRLVAGGVGVPGPVDFGRGRPVSPPIMPGWDRYPVRERLSRALGLPMVLDNDVNMMALGELHSGVARRLESFLFVKIGTGIGCGIVVDGRLYRGVDGCAGDIGHIRAEDTGPLCACGNVGCLEAFFSGAALARDGLAAAQAGRSEELARLLEERGRITAVEVSEAAGRGDAASVALVRAGGQRLGGVLAGLVSFFNPGMVVVGGEVATIGHELLAEIRSVVYRRSLPLATGNLPVVHSELAGSAGVIGASRAASDQVFSGDFAK